MAQGVVQGRWSDLLNGCWSPGYPAALSAGILVITQHEQLAVKLINYLLFALACIGFSFLLKKQRLSVLQTIVCWTWWQFISISLMNVQRDSPDFAVAAIVFFLAGLLIDAMRDRAYQPILMGALIGVGYLFKASFLPIGLLVLLSLFWRNRRSAWIATVSLVAIVAPYVISLSAYKGRVTIGDNGWLNWAIHVQRLPVPPIWYGDPINGYPKHPIQRIGTNPEIVTFRDPFVHATYPLAYDASYWLEGVRSRISMPLILLAVHRSAVYYYGVLIQPVTLALIVLTLCLLALARFRIDRIFLTLGALGITGVLLFLPVHMEPRYIGAYLALISVAFIPCVQVRRRYLGIAAILFTLVGTYQTWRTLVRSPRIDDANFRFAKQLRGLGIHSGDSIAIVGDAYFSAWAHLDSLHIAAQVPDKDEMLQRNPKELKAISSKLEHDLSLAAVISQSGDRKMKVVDVAVNDRSVMAAN